MENESRKIYFLPTLMTGGNLMCGFAAILSVLHDSTPERAFFVHAIVFIVAACIFDFLDGQVARLRGQESNFGRELDSLADLVSFGVAPALLVYRLVLKDFPPVGSALATVYVLCCALRLARFNCTAADITMSDTRKTFDGLPVPAAAGSIASLTWVLLSLTSDGHPIVSWNRLLPPLMVFLSLMMLSHFSYPSFKALHLSRRHLTLKILSVILVLAAFGGNYRVMPAVLFTGYLFYGMLPPRLSIKQRRQV